MAKVEEGGATCGIHDSLKRCWAMPIMAENGAIYILKMGQPVKIIDMAEDLIRLSGFKPHKDIRIEFTGLRPGEKLCEELFTEDEGIVPTFHDKLMVLKSYSINGIFCYSYLGKKIEELGILHFSVYTFHNYEHRK